MFTDIIGSTAISAGLDPEHWHNILRTYYQALSSIIFDHEGYIGKYLGDGVLAYFGYPKAFEHSTEQAVRAGLEIVKAANSIVASEELVARL